MKFSACKMLADIIISTTTIGEGREGEEWSGRASKRYGRCV